MQSITRRLNDTSTILANLPKLLDLADERELSMLAALVRGYVECGGPEDWQSRPGYLEWVTIATLIKEGDEITQDDVAQQEFSIPDAGIDYLRDLRESAVSSDEAFQEWRLVTSALGLARFGEPVDPKRRFDGDRKPCSMRRAFELTIAEADAEEARKQNKVQAEASEAQGEAEIPYEQMTPAARRKALTALEKNRKGWQGVFRDMDREADKKARKLRRLIQQDAGRKAVPIDSKRRQRKAA